MSKTEKSVNSSLALLASQCCPHTSVSFPTATTFEQRLISPAFSSVNLFLFVVFNSRQKLSVHVFERMSQPAATMSKLVRRVVVTIPYSAFINVAALFPVKDFACNLDFFKKSFHFHLNFLWTFIQ